ncbi:MAG TPA: thrombospondin, partial [Polyangiaceae bacterium]|nr:thrombospondin [Polyangiaceae bacterium]
MIVVRVGCLGAALMMSTMPAAAECDNAARLSTCIDADTLWLHPGPGRFQAIGSTETTASEEFSLGFFTTYFRNPIVLRASSANPDGVDVPAIEHMVNSTFLWGYGLSDRVELTLAMPVTLYQNGTGVSGFLSSQSQEVPTTSMRDLRLGATWSLLPRSRVHSDELFALTVRMQAAIPTGDEQWFGGDRGFVGIPSLAGDMRLGRFFAATELGVRIRKTTNLAGSRIGSQSFLALGAGVDLLPSEWLSVGVEAYALPGLVGQETLERDPANGELIGKTKSESLIPAEWMTTLRSAPTRGGDLSFYISGGSALPLDGTAMTAPQMRWTAGVRFAPLHRDSDGDGVIDSLDQCPYQPEDRDGFQDE